MIRIAAAVAIAVLVGIPIATAADVVVIPIALLAAATCGTGLVRHSLGLVTAGAWLAVFSYAAALVLAGSEPQIAAAVVFGVALLLLMQLGEFARQLDGAALDPPLLRAQALYWLTVAALAAAAVAALVLIGAALAPLLAGPARIAVAGCGAAIAFGAALYAAGWATPSRGP
jgi:hypothetical protein